jgi:anaerobic ribonucleoside-triphosphate reductase
MNALSFQKQTQPAITLSDEERTRCEVWTRVMGYHRPMASFNKGKRSEHRERRFYLEDCCKLS